jgi:UDP-glucuronate decarboxylase
MNIHAIIDEDIMRIIEEDLPWEKLRGQTVLVTGASGLIGSYLCYTVLQLNDTYSLNITVLGLVHNGEKARKEFHRLLNRSDFKLLVQEVYDPADYPSSVDYIIHAASITAGFKKNPVEVISANAIATDVLLKLAVRKNSKCFLYPSTREIYGKVEGDKRFAGETDIGIVDPVALRSCYSESKRMGESLCVAYKSQYGLCCRIARLAHSYGPSFVMDNGRVWGDFISNIVRRENIVLRSKGETELTLTYISDTVIGLFYLILKGTELVYNLSRMDEVIKVRDLASKLVQQYEERKLKVVIDIPKDDGGYLTERVPILDSSKAFGLGWRPKVGVEEGFRRTVEYHETKEMTASSI